MLFRFLLIRQEWQSKECTTRKYLVALVPSRAFTNLRPDEYSQGRLLPGAGASEVRSGVAGKSLGTCKRNPVFSRTSSSRTGCNEPPALPRAYRRLKPITAGGVS